MTETQPPTPLAVEERQAIAVSAVDAFEIGYGFAMGLRGQTLEDSRAVGRFLGSDLFAAIADRMRAAEKDIGFDPFTNADSGIVQAKAIIHAALATPTANAPVDDKLPATVREIETVAGDFGTEKGTPFYRIELGGYVADFDYREAAENFAAQINSLTKNVATNADMRGALEGFVNDLTDNGRNRGNCLSIDHDGLNARIAAARTVLQGDKS